MASNAVTNGDEQFLREEPRRRSSSLPNGPAVNGLAVDGNSRSLALRGIAFDGRLKRKSKRLAKFSLEENGSTASWNGNGSSGKFNKNSRRSRSGFGRGLPKKGGAGGKGTWGKLGIELMMDDEDIVADIHDPNYDPENQGVCEFESSVPEIVSLEDLQRTIEPSIREYFEHGDTQEVILTFSELNFGTLRPQIVSVVISLAMERKPSHCEMTSVLISDMYGRVISQENIAEGFEYLLLSLADIVLDTPDASTIVGNFIARAVADDCIPPKFVHTYKDNADCPYARSALEHADALLNMKHGLVRLDNVWGVGGGMRPVKYLINQMQLLLKEYVCSGDISEACRCVQELEVPHFHHELIYEAVVMVIEDMRDSTMHFVCKLLKLLSSSIIVTHDQMVRGFLRVYEDMPEICIDVPPAYTVLEKFISVCQKARFLPDEVLKKMPSRGRKRFVSEGDGGLVKTSDF